MKLSNISRSLNEWIALIKTEGRLPRCMGKGDLSERINQALVADGGVKVSDDTVIALDISDIFTRSGWALWWSRGMRRSR